jgi:hypothetical protein
MSRVSFVYLRVVVGGVDAGIKLCCPLLARLVESLDGRLLVEKTEHKYEFKTDTKVGKVG